MTDLRQAEPICPDCKAAVLYECVACSSNNYPPLQVQTADKFCDANCVWTDHHPDCDLAQPEQRPWVELTPEEILDLFDINNVYGSKWIEFARTVESKLKEKNT